VQGSVPLVPPVPLVVPETGTQVSFEPHMEPAQQARLAQLAASAAHVAPLVVPEEEEEVVELLVPVVPEATPVELPVVEPLLLPQAARAATANTQQRFKVVFMCSLLRPRGASTAFTRTTASIPGICAVVTRLTQGWQADCAPLAG